MAAPVPGPTPVTTTTGFAMLTSHHSPPTAADIASAFLTVARMVLAPPKDGSTLDGSVSRLASSASASEALVRIDEVLLAGRLLAVDRDLLQPQRLRERDLLVVATGECRFDLRRDTLAQLLRGCGSDLLQERRQQPAADAPGHAEVAGEFGGAAVKTSVDVHLLVLRRTVAAVFARRSIGGRFHAGEQLTRELAAADRVECERGAGGGERFDELVHERRRTRSQHVLRTESLEKIHVLLSTDDVHERDPVFDAELDQHLAEVRRRGGVHQSGVALRAHRLGHAERRQRVHEARCALRGGRAGR